MLRSFRVVAVGASHTGGILVGRVEYIFINVGERGEFGLGGGVVPGPIDDARRLGHLDTSRISSTRLSLRGRWPTPILLRRARSNGV